MGFRYDEEKHEMFSANVTNTGAATDKEIVAADTNERIGIYKLVFTSSAECDFTLKSGSTVLLGPTEPVKQMVLDQTQCLVSGVNENLSYTTDTGNSQVYVEYFKSKDGKV